MRICIIGKFPPIQGGVSMRTYWTAHGLAARGHEVHVVTNAKEVRPPFRMHMRPEDWMRCEATGASTVTVHWTDPVDRSQSYIPMASPFVTKLATLATGAHAAQRFDVIFSHYMEPYGIAGHLASQMTGIPHVVRMAGSDAGRLWHHPQFEALYDHVLRSAEAIVVTGAVAERAIGRGVDAHRVVAGGSYALPEALFTPDGPRLDLFALARELETTDADAGLRDAHWGHLAPGMPYFGIYGKLGDNKGSFAILAAMQCLKDAGVNAGLVALAHGRPEIERRFRDRVQELGLTDRVLQIPFLPHWRVPEFLRGCLAVCCLEQNFPIGFHSPITPLEVLMCGRCLVGSTEVIRKLPQWQRLPHGYGCVAIEDVNDIETLSHGLAAIARDPKTAAGVGTRGQRFAHDLQRDSEFPQRLEHILEMASRRKSLARTGPATAPQDEIDAATNRFRLTRMAAAALEAVDAGHATPLRPEAVIDLSTARKLLRETELAVANGKTSLRPLALAIEIEIAIAGAEDQDGAPSGVADPDPLFRLSSPHWALRDGDLAAMRPKANPYLRVLHFDYDISAFRTANSAAEFPPAGNSHPSHMVVFDRSARQDPLLVDGLTARFLEVSDGSWTVGDIIEKLRKEFGSAGPEGTLEWIEDLFLWGLISLDHAASTTGQASD